MSKSRPENKQEFKDYLIRKLGGEWTPIELSDDNLEDIVMDALTFYTEQIYDGTKNVVVNLQVQSGVLEYDLRAYPQVGDKIFAVIEVLAGGFNSSLFPSSFGLSQNEINFLFSLGSIASGNLVDFTIKMQHFSAFSSVFLPKANWNYNYGTGILTFASDPSKLLNLNGQSVMHLICSAVVDYDGTGSGRYWGNRFLLSYGTALSWIQYGINLGKFENMQMPGSGNPAFQAFIDRGTTMKTDLETFALENLSHSPEGFEIYQA